MENLFLGFFFVFFDFNLNLGSHVLGLIPDAVGYYLLLKGLQELSGKSKKFDEMQPWAKGLMIYGAICWVLDLLAADISFLSVSLGLLSTAAGLYLSYNIIKGIQEIEHFHATNLNGELLMKLWKISAVCQILVYAIVVFAFLPLLVNFVVTILFTIAMKECKDRYHALGLS